MEGISVKLQSGFRTKTVNPKADGKSWIKKYKVMQDNDSSQDLFKRWKYLLENS